MCYGELTPFYTTNHTNHLLLQFQTWPVPCKTKQYYYVAHVQSDTAQVCGWKSVPAQFNNTKDAQPADTGKVCGPEKVWQAVEVPDIELVMQGPTAGYTNEVGSEKWQQK